MSYVIAIPSYKRPTILREKTLKLLAECTIPNTRIHVFLSSEEERESYALGEQITVHVCPDAHDAGAKFNAIHNAFEKGTHVVVLEDDIDDLVSPRKVGENGAVPFRDLESLIAAGWKEISSGGLWGVTPHSNVFFMSGKVSSTLKLIVAHIFGFCSTQKKSLEVTAPSKTDYERTLRYFVSYGKVTRLDWVGIKTKSYAQEGGTLAQFDQDARGLLEAEACAQLVARWPHLVAPKTKKSSPFAELRLKPCKLSRQELQGMQRVLDRTVASR